MASGQVLQKLRNYYAKAEFEVQKWRSSQERLMSLLGTICNILERIPALQGPKNYGELNKFPGYREKLLGKQLIALEDLLGEAQVVLRDMQLAVQALEKTFKNAERTLLQDKRLTAAARAVTAGPVPSINQCLEGLENIWRMHSEELLLQQALTAQVGYGRKAEDLREVLRAAVAKPNIEEQKIKDLFHILAATAEIRG